MLSADEVLPARLNDLRGLSLLLPRTGYGTTFLVTDAGDVETAVWLDEGEKAYTFFNAEEGSAWKGAAISGLQIQLDEGSLFDPYHELAPLGALIREGTTLCIAARSPVPSVTGSYLLPLIVDLPSGAPGVRLGFTRWQLTLGRKSRLRTVWSIDLGTPGMRSASP